MGLKIKFRDETLSSMVVHTLRTHLPGFDVYEDGNCVIVGHPKDKTEIEIEISDNDLNMSPPVFRYNRTIPVFLFFLLIMPVTVAGSFFLSYPLVGVIFVAPFSALLIGVYKKTRKMQYAKYINYLAFYQTVAKVIKMSYVGAIAPPEKVKKDQ